MSVIVMKNAVPRHVSTISFCEAEMKAPKPFIKATDPEIAI